MKRWLSILLAAMMVFSMASVYASAAEAEEPEPSVIVETEPAEGSGADASLELMADHEVWEKDHKTELEVGVNKTLKIWFYSKGGCDGVVRRMTFKSSDKNIMVISDKQKLGGSDKGAVWVRVKGLKEGTAVLTATIRGGLGHSGEVYCSADVKIIVKGSGSSDPSPAPAPDPTPTGKTPAIESSESSVKLAANSSHKVKVTRKNTSSDQMGFSISDSAYVTAEWGDWLDSSHNSKYLIIKGLKEGSAVITLYAGDGNGNILASSKISVSVTAASSSDTKKPGKPKVKVKKATKKLISLSWKKVSKASGYEVCLSIKGNPKTFPVKGTSYQINLTGAKSKMAYKVKVRAYKLVNDKKIYGGWTTKKGKLK